MVECGLLKYTAGLASMSDNKVVQIGDLRIARTKDDYRRKLEGCPHLSISMDDRGDTVTCNDCHKQVSAYWALKLFTESWDKKTEALNHALEQAKRERETSLHLKAAKLAESAWRSQKSAPTCPHCRRGIFADDGFGRATVNKLFEQGLRVRERAEAIEKGTFVAKLAPGKPPAAAKAVKPRTKGKPAPKWENAPEWAQWLTCNRKGHWFWHAGEPVDQEGEWHSHAKREFAGSTLTTEFTKQQRPQSEELRP